MARLWRRSRTDIDALPFMLRAMPAACAVNLKAKISRLRRERKDSLIVRLLQLEAERKRQSDREDTLREEILRLHQSTGGKGVGQ